MMKGWWGANDTQQEEEREGEREGDNTGQRRRRNEQ